jgi:hypothetical protein
MTTCKQDLLSVLLARARAVCPSQASSCDVNSACNTIRITCHPRGRLVTTGTLG